MHSGHRARLKNRFLAEGLDHFEPHNKLELLLFYAIPQKDTNPIAHELLARFGSLQGVFDADIHALCAVDGISEHTAILIKMVPAIYRSALEERSQTETYTTLDKLGKRMMKQYIGVTREIAYLVLLDNQYHMLDLFKVGEGSVNEVVPKLRDMVEHALFRNAAQVVLVHNHPNGLLIPSVEDLNATAEVKNMFEKLNVHFLDHLLVTDRGYLSLSSDQQGSFWQKSQGLAYDTKTETYIIE